MSLSEYLDELLETQEEVKEYSPVNGINDQLIMYVPSVQDTRVYLTSYTTASASTSTISF